MVRNGTAIHKSVMFVLDKFMIDLSFGKSDREGNIPLISAILNQLSILVFQLKKWVVTKQIGTREAHTYHLNQKFTKKYQFFTRFMSVSGGLILTNFDQ